MNKEELMNYIYNEIFKIQTGWSTQDMDTVNRIDERLKVYNEILDLLEGIKHENNTGV